jgi:hypothetical protein
MATRAPKTIPRVAVVADKRREFLKDSRITGVNALEKYSRVNPFSEIRLDFSNVRIGTSWKQTPKKMMGTNGIQGRSFLVNMRFLGSE